MLHNKKIGVVIPAFQEAERIGAVISTMPAFVDHIYVIDDSSTDGTGDRARSTAPVGTTTVTVHRHDSNRGVGAAIVTGYELGISAGDDVLAVMAGDAQMDPAELATVVQPVIDGAADYVKGNRFHYGTAWEVMPRYRFIGNAILSLLTKIASGYWKLSDFQTGYTAISREAARTIPLRKLYRRYGFPNDLLVKLNVLNARVHEVPIKPIYQGEKSGIRIAHVVPRISWLLVKDFFWRMREKYVVRDFHPLVFFYFFGFMSFIVGFVFGLYLLMYRIVTGPVSETSALFAALFFLFGTQSLFFAMWFDMESNKDLQQ
ncbi:MAG: glycosyltransferase family 2 protein [Patescibacteria group bacterium]